MASQQNNEPKIVAMTTPMELRAWRYAIGFNIEQFACLLGTAAGRTVRRWEDGSRPIPTYVDSFYELFLLSTANREWMLRNAIDEWNWRFESGMFVNEIEERWTVSEEFAASFTRAGFNYKPATIASRRPLPQSKAD